MKHLISTLVAVVIAIAACITYVETTRPKIGVIDLVQVYDGFTMTQEFDAKYASMGQMRQSQLDSLELRVREVQATAQAQQTEGSIRDFQVARDHYLQLQDRFEADQEQALAVFYEQIVDRVDQYFEDYKTEEGYDLLIKTRQEEMSVESDPEFDATTDFINYVNHRYEGL